MKKSMKRISIFFTIILILAFATLLLFPSEKNTYFPSSEPGVVFVQTETAKSVYQTMLGTSSCPSGTTTPYCSSLSPNAYYKCSNGVTNKYSCSSGQTCKEGVGCSSLTCPSGTTTPYCSSVDINSYFMCKNGITNKYVCNSDQRCSFGVGCATITSSSTTTPVTTTTSSCPSGTTTPYCSSISPNAYYICKDGTTYKYGCSSGQSCSNGKCISLTTTQQTSTTSCPAEKLVDAKFILTDSASGRVGVQSYTCEKWFKYTLTNNQCVEDSYCKSQHTQCQSGYAIEGTTVSEADGLKNCILINIESTTPTSVDCASNPQLAECQTILESTTTITEPIIVNGSPCTTDTLSTCTDGTQITISQCLNGINVNTENTCENAGSTTVNKSTTGELAKVSATPTILLVVGFLIFVVIVIFFIRYVSKRK